MRVERFVPYLGIVAALIVGVTVLYFFGGVAVPRVSTNNAFPTVSSTLSSSSSSPLPLDSTQPEAGDAMASAPHARITAVPADTETQSSSASATSVQSAVAQPPARMSLTATEQAELDSSASVLRAALVNIICYVPAGSGLPSISGSGVFIDPKGVILTNAHIAQYFLLAGRGVSCDIRVGSPAADKYNAALAYISPAWINANKDVLAQTAPSGTGEYDFAFLAVTKSATSAPLPSSFPHIPLATSAPSHHGAPVVIASYGAQFLASSQVQSSLFPTIVFGSVKDVFTFASSTIDVLALGGSAAAQEGSSGGGVADVSGALMGVITTSTTEGATDTRKLDAITASYIRAEYARETGQSLDALLAKPVSEVVAAFAPSIPALEALITVHLP